MKRRVPALAALAAAVGLIHLELADTVLDNRLGDVAARGGMRRIEVAFVRELAAAPPVAVMAAPPAPAPARPRARPPARPASTPEAAPEPPVLPPVEPPPASEVAALPAPAASQPEATAVAAEPPASAPSVATAAADPLAAVPPASSASSAAPIARFDWPPSTRMSYTLTGHYRGPVEGQARVEWLRSGERYQVHLDVSIGPFFAPLVSRRMSSEGEVTAAGLRPRRYEEETRMPLAAPRRLAIVFDDDRIRLPSGQELARPAGVQDSASQFVQMTWMFTLQPALLEIGRTVELPLALPRRVEPWLYDVAARETLYTPVGELQTVHVRPRRVARPGGDLTAEFWVAPSLQYLPVRIVIRQDAETHVDLLVDRLPQQAAAAAGGASSPR